MANRVRKQSQPHSPQTHTISFLGGASGTPVNETLPSSRPAYEQTTIDVVVPRFHVRSKAGEIFNNPFESIQKWFSCGGEYVGEGWISGSNGVPDTSKGYVRHTWSGGGFYAHSIGYAPEASFTAELDSLLNKSRIGACAKVNRSDVMSYVTVGEWHKTKVLHKQVGFALLNVVKSAYARKKFIGGVTKAASSLWLTYRYAVMPTVLELEGAVKLLDKKVAERYTARDQQAAPSVSSTLLSVAADSHGWFLNFRATCHSELQCRSGILYESSDFGRYAAGLGLTRPLSSVYELTRFSWMVDWWIDIGTWLDAIEPNGASKTLSAWSGWRIRHTHTLELTSMSQTGGTAVDRAMNKTRTMTGFYRNYIVDRKVRNPWSGSPPLFPAKGSGLNRDRCADVISLFGQRLKVFGQGYVRGIRF